MNREELRNQFQADLRKFRKSTIERKQMSTKTTFKRIALVAVAALGLGVISVAPSQAAASGTTVVTTNGAASFRAGSTDTINGDTPTGATVTVSSLLTTANDTVTVAFYQKTKPTLASWPTSYIAPIETSSANTFISALAVGTGGALAVAPLQKRPLGAASRLGVATAGYQVLAGGAAGGDDVTRAASPASSTLGNVGATFSIYMDTATTPLVGTYTYSVVTTTYSVAGPFNAATNALPYTITTDTRDVTITVSANATVALTTGKTPAAANATAFIGTATGPTEDAVITAVSTASTTPVAYVKMNVNNTNGNSGVAEDSLTATLTGPGLICDGSVCGKSLSGIALTAGTKELTVRADGNAGVATVNVSSTVTTFAAKTVTFYAKAAKTLTSSVRVPVLGVGANSGAVSVAAVDASGIAWTGTAYIYASSAADALIAGSETPSACSYTATTGIRCDITGKLVGTAKFKVIDAATVATATATSNEVTVTVSAGTPGSVKIAFDKSTYAPFEKAKITITVLDTAGKALPAQTVANVFTAGGITSSIGFSANSETLTATSIVLDAASSATTGAEAGSEVHYVYMPAGSGDVTISATGGTGLALAGRVAVSATASVVNSSVDAATDAANEATDAANAATDAALAAADAADAATAAAQDASDAVAALSASVSKLISSLRAQITSLTNLVIKIQKKVRA
jgi:hypothetical protein